LVSEVSKKEIKEWKKRFEYFLSKTVFDHVQKSKDDLIGLECFLMGFYHEQGFQVSKDYPKALEYFELGCLKRDPLCLYKLYELSTCKNNYGIEVDHEKGVLYIIWTIVYLLTYYGSYILFDVDMEFKYCFQNYFNKSKASVF
jgi:hypothetical protein